MNTCLISREQKIIKITQVDIYSSYFIYLLIKK